MSVRGVHSRLGRNRGVVDSSRILDQKEHSDCDIPEGRATGSDEVTMSVRSAFQTCVLVCCVMPFACAVATEDFPGLDGDAGSGGKGSNVAGSLGVSGSNDGGTPTSTGGKPSSTAGSNAFGGTVSSGGKGGSTSTGGKPGTAGGGGMMSTAGSAGSPTAGSSSGGSGGMGCSGLKMWISEMSLGAAQGEVIQWMGKRYKANMMVGWANGECVPDKPMSWCASWFTADGSC